jgi:hypothetical protein
MPRTSRFWDLKSRERAYRESHTVCRIANGLDLPGLQPLVTDDDLRDSRPFHWADCARRPRWRAPEEKMAMNRFQFAVIGVLASLLVTPSSNSQSSTAQQAPGTQVQPTAQESVQQTNDAFVEKITKQIAGHEQEPAEKVFKNVQIMKNVPAGRLLLIMNLGYSRALGVTCTHCHVEQDFSSDDKRPKRAAREMAVMHRSINDQLAKMQNLEPNPKGHFINCSTCHRGAVDPMASEK